jgi:hypothetical protein
VLITVTNISQSILSTDVGMLYPGEVKAISLDPAKCYGVAYTMKPLVDSGKCTLTVQEEPERLNTIEPGVLGTVSDNAVTTAKIANLNVTEDKLATAVATKLNGALQKAGGTMTGNIVMTSTSDIVTADTADAVNSAGFSIQTGDADAGNSGDIVIDTGASASGTTGIIDIGASNASAVSIGNSGGSVNIYSDLNMDGGSITSVAAGVDPGDAVNMGQLTGLIQRFNMEITLAEMQALGAGVKTISKTQAIPAHARILQSRYALVLIDNASDTAVISLKAGNAGNDDGLLKMADVTTGSGTALEGVAQGDDMNQTFPIMSLMHDFGGAAGDIITLTITSDVDMNTLTKGSFTFDFFVVCVA